MTNTSANLSQVGGTHYKSKYEHWDFVAQAGLGYFEGQITKYVSRARKKNGLQDVEKAAHFLDKLIELSLQGYLPCNGYATRGLVSRFVEANDLSEQEARVTLLVAFWRRADALIEARAAVTLLTRLYPAQQPKAPGTPFNLSPEQERAVDDTAGVSEEGSSP